jgi:N12 class adenine-specific DNA methylase
MSHRRTSTRRASRQPESQLSLDDLFAEWDESEIPAPTARPDALAVTPPWPLPGPAARRSPSRRAADNIAALRVLRSLQASGGQPDAGQRAALALWSGWGALPEVFESRAGKQPRWAAGTQAQLGELLDAGELRAARRSILNAHYTDPAIAGVMWQAAAAHGFTGGQVLEPGCGAGLLAGLAPAGARMTGVELDPATAAIAAALCPGMDVRCQSFAALDAPRGFFDLAIGNVPFGDFRMPEADPVTPESGQWSIHNACLYKALALTRPGGLLIALTSAYTLDAADANAREAIAGLADLIGAVRLPASSHEAAAGTRVVMDLIVLRRREDGREPAGPAWTESRCAELRGEKFWVSPLFLRDGAGMVLGKMGLGTSGHGPVITVRADGAAPLHEQLAAAVTVIAQRAAADGLAMTPRAGDAPAGPLPAAQATALMEGHITDHGSGRFSRVDGGRDCPHDVPRSQRAELAALCGLRDAVSGLLDAEGASTGDTPQTTAGRARLNGLYDAYARKWGPLNRFASRPTGWYAGECPACGEETRVTREPRPARQNAKGVPAGGNAGLLPGHPGVLAASCTECAATVPVSPALARVPPRQGGFRADPLAPLVYALEDFDPATQAAEKAPVFTGRVVAYRAHPDTAATPADALAICLDALGRVDLARIARLLGLDGEDAARAALDGLAYPDPEQHGRLVPAAEYLSGNVRVKLAAAEEAARDDAAYEPGVAALREALPPDLTPEQISARLGSSWIPAGVVQQFLREILDDARLDVEHPGGSWWSVSPGKSETILSVTKWGTRRYPAYELAEALLCQKPVRVLDNVGTAVDPVYVLNPDETLAAAEKAKELDAAFAEWLWADGARSARLARDYNDMFNSLVLRSYDGIELTLPGLADWFRPMIHPHQHAAVARMIAEPATGLFHVVGAGKTAEMAMGVMELRRLGLISLACVVVPNHMLEQFGREWLQLYPQAKILLTTTDDLSEKGRRRLHARVATGRWDAVIMTQSAFGRIPMSADGQREYFEAEIARLAGLLAAGADRSAKEIQAVMERMKIRLAARLDRLKDPGLTWEQMGVDYLVVDEAHAYKNLLTASRTPDAAIAGSGRSSDLHMKTEWLRARYARWATFATATPVANSITEVYVMFRYLRPDLLEGTQCTDFDTWAATFGRVVGTIELAVEGGTSFRLKYRFSEFYNVPDLQRLFHVFGDVKLADDLTLNVPLIAARPDGKRAPCIITVEPDPALTEYVKDLGERAELIRAREPRRYGTGEYRMNGKEITKPDNLLRVCTHGRLAALDLRLVGLAQDEPGKTAAVAAQILKVRARHPGKLQIVFCDLGTPKPGRWNAYDDIAGRLRAGGVPAHRVRYAHQARNDQEKAELFLACTRGDVDVIIGSTAKMGTGVNIQRLAIALHHVDAPWRPADVEQRDGRIIRQGNRNPEAEIYIYVTLRSFDGFMWQALLRKQRFIEDFLKVGGARVITGDVGDVTMSYDEIRSVATANPDLLAAAKARAEVARLSRSARAHEQAQRALEYAIGQHARTIAMSEDRVMLLDSLLRRRTPTAGDLFAMRIGEDAEPVTSRADAGRALLALAAARCADTDAAVRMQGRPVAGQAERVGELAGFGVILLARGLPGGVGQPEAVLVSAEFALEGVPESSVILPVDELEDSDPAHLVTRLENRASRLEAMIGTAQRAIANAESETAHARAQLGQPFPGAWELREAEMRLSEVERRMQDAAMGNDRRDHQRAAGSPAPEKAAA